LENTHFILGPNVQEFENETAAYLGVNHAVSCASGTDALHLALVALGVGPGDEVITTPFTFIATAEAIRYVGATPVFVDIDERTFNIDLNQLEAALTPATKAVIPVHLFGQPVDTVSLKAFCEAHDLLLVEDCAQSFGAAVKDRMTGGFGDAGCFSFFPSKNLGGVGDGGLVTSQSDEVAARLRMLRNHGSSKRYYHDTIGFNSRLDELQAVVLRIKLKHIDRYNQERRRVAHRYNDGLVGTDILTPHEDGIGTHVFHQYTLLSDRRDRIMAALSDKEIASAIYYPVPLHQQKAFQDTVSGQNFPVTESVAARCLSLPIFPELENSQIDTICEVIKEAIQ
jgi:dTDP-4-amino-4,6-dideoxygalactose transaminase